MTIATIIVGYKNEGLSISYIKNEISKFTVNNIIIIVNNASTKQSCEIFQSELGAYIVDPDFTIFENCHQVYVIDVNENLGFAKANNLGAEFVRRFFPSIEYILFSNNDIKIVSNDVIDVLLSKLRSDNKIGLIGPNIVGIDGKRQNPMPKPSITHLIFNPWLHYIKDDDRYCNKAGEGFHYTFAECFFVCRLKDYFNCGMMDSFTFLYAEGCILSERMLSIGLRYYFVPSVTVIHENGTTTSKKYTLYRIRMLMAKANSYYLRNYRGYSKLSVGIYMISEKLRCIFSWIKYKIR